MRIARELIDADADKVVRRLARHGFQAYLVGGCVRDLLLSRTPKDFDVATNATPKEIKQLFRNCRIIGRRFRLAHIFFGPKIIETSTFRANPREGEEASDSEEILIRRDNVFGSDTEDARRRDFTINGLFYDVEAEKVIDHVGGLEDLERRVVHTIGDPDIRFREDPVRMLRAVKFAARLGFDIEPTTLAALVRHRGEIAKCAQPRVLEEIYRLLRGGAAHRSMELLIETGIASVLSPHLVTLFGLPEGGAIAPTPRPEGGPALPAGYGEDAEAPGRLRTMARSAAVPARSASRLPRASTEERAWAAVWADEAAETGVSLEARFAETADDEPATGWNGTSGGVVEAEAEAEVDIDVDMDTDADADAEAEADADTETEADTDADTETDVEAAIEAEGEGFGADAGDGDLDEVEAGAGAEDDADEDEDDDEDALFDDDEDGEGVFDRAARAPAAPIAPERRALAWAMLHQFDEQFQAGTELSNSLLLAAVCVPFLFDDLVEGSVRPVEASEAILEILHPMVQQLQVARRDAERSRQILLAQRRLAPARRRRGKPMSLVRRDFFSDALLLYQMMSAVGGRDSSDLAYWSRLHGQDGGDRGDDPRGGKRRRRRRGGRRRRRTPSEEQGGEREPALTH